MESKIVMERLQGYRSQIKKDLSELIAINSERDLRTKGDNAPFGLGIRKCFDKMIEFANREGFAVKDFDGYAIHIEYGDGPETLAILGHLDTVGIYDVESWSNNPFKLTEKNGHWYGRGVNDNKGPMIGCLYVLKILKELNFNPRKRIRLIMGGAEETTWECMDHYFRHSDMPNFGFSPDGDFPIVNCEKGIGYYKYCGKRRPTNDGIFNITSIEANEDITRVCSRVEISIETKKIDKLLGLLPTKVKAFTKDDSLKVVYEGVPAIGRNPHKGQNAIFSFVKDFEGIQGLDTRSQDLIKLLSRYFVDSIYGEKLGIFHKDEETGQTTSNLSYVILNDTGYMISFDYRYPKGMDYRIAIGRLMKIGSANELELIKIKERPLLYISPDNDMISALKRAYESITGDKAKLFSKGAASYARTLKQGVAFGPTFSVDSPNSHKSNECINVDNFIKALLIYAKAIKLLDEL